MPLELVSPDKAPVAASGLRRGILSPMEVLSQSMSAIAPTTCANRAAHLSTGGQWSVALIHYCRCRDAPDSFLHRFTRAAALPGSLHEFATDSLPPIAGAAAA